jgi:hypothetical protein
MTSSNQSNTIYSTGTEVLPKACPVEQVHIKSRLLCSDLPEAGGQHILVALLVYAFQHVVVSSYMFIASLVSHTYFHIYYI